MMDLNRWIALINSSVSADRVEAADTLPDSGASPEVLERLLTALSDDEALVRACAADTLGQIKTEDVRQKIRQRLDTEPDKFVKAFLLSSLGAMENMDDIPLLLSELRATDDSLVRLHAAYGLLLSCVGPTFDVIVTACDHGDWKQRTSALSTLDVSTDLLQDIIAYAKDAAERNRRAAEDGEISGSALETIKRIMDR